MPLPSSSLLASCAADVVKTWEVEAGGGELQPRHVLESKATGEFTAVAWNHNSQVLASSSTDGTIQLNHVQGKLLAVLPSGTESVRAIAFSITSRYLCSGGTERVAKVYDLKRKSVIRTLKGHTAPITAVSFNADGHYVASGSDAGVLMLHRTKSSNKEGKSRRSRRSWKSRS